MAELWRLKPELSWVQLPVAAGLFTFLYFCLITSKFLYFQHEARCSEHLLAVVTWLFTVCSILPCALLVARCAGLSNGEIRSSLKPSVYLRAPDKDTALSFHAYVLSLISAAMFALISHIDRTSLYCASEYLTETQSTFFCTLSGL